MTELEFWGLLVYWVDTKLMGVDKSRLKLSTISKGVLVYTEWYGYNRSQLLFLMLKSSIITKILFRLTSVFFRYFKMFCWLSK